MVSTLFLLLVIGFQVQAQSPIKNAERQWPMASGPKGNWTTSTEEKFPTYWSVSTGSNILWKTELPEGGQSGIAVWSDRLYLTINRPLPPGTPLEKAEGSDIIAYCLNANTGKILWTREIPGPKTMPYSGLFSDNTSATPITDGRHVWFINQGGAMVCFDKDGNEVWRRTFESRTRHNAKQCEPILVDNQLLFVLMRDADDPLRRPTKAEPGDRNTPPELWPWTFIRSFDATTGQPLWTETTATSVHNTPRLGYLNNEAVVFHGRGGGHQPPEVPYGFSMSKVGGKTLWNYESKSTVTYTVSHFDEQHAYGFDSGSLVKLDSLTGKAVDTFPLFEKADLRLWNSSKKNYESHRDSPFAKVIQKFKPEPTNQTPILVGKYFLFMTHEGHCIGRVNTETGGTEFLQVPIQVVRQPNAPDQILWDRHIPSDGKNSRGMATTKDRRAKGDGWGHVTAGSPIAVNQYVFFPTMLGMTYFIDSQARIFDESALVSVSDLGPAGETWSLSSPSYSQGKIYHRGLKHVVCIGFK